jgi:hypothetical protein
MDKSLRRGWTEIVEGDDLDAHMAENGQARANAELLDTLLRDATLAPGGRIAFVGAGTGQLLDFMDVASLAGRPLVFTDINERFLKRIRERLRRHPEIGEATVIHDDVEATRLASPIYAVVIVLVLEHVEWRCALTALCATDPVWLLIVIQRNDATAPVVTMERKLRPSIRAFAEAARPQLVDERELTGWLSDAGFSLAIHLERRVEDAKTMIGLGFKDAGRRYH